ncbi:hypothetical protein PUN28_002310 [Cardiocondyla obscurior]|uniref:Uncharacterized protein n=1 Tax=Cardiocondyla obscurior TaxID=286306 RepID=A0AAW2GTK7_9HYME
MGTSTVFLFPAITIPKRFPRRAAHQRPIATSSSAAGKRSNPPRKRPHANDDGPTQPLSKTARLRDYPGRMSANEPNMFQTTSASCLELCASGEQNAEETRATEATGLSSPCVHPLEVNVDLVDPGGSGLDSTVCRACWREERLPPPLSPQGSRTMNNSLG